MTQPVNHATTADIQAILKARQTTTPIVVPALLPKLSAQAQSVSTAPAQPAATPVLAAPVSDTDFATFLQAHLPQIQAKATDIAHGFRLPKLFDLATEVSAAVRDGLPLAKGQDAAHIVQVVTGYAFDHYLLPALPAQYQMFAGLLRPLLLQGIEAVYQTMVKPRK